MSLTNWRVDRHFAKFPNGLNIFFFYLLINRIISTARAFRIYHYDLIITMLM